MSHPGRPTNRPDPLMPVGAYKTYQIKSPVSTHFRPAACQEVECRAFRNGWTTAVDVGTPLGAQQANYIRLHSGRSYTATETNNRVIFTFPPGQQCFTQHQVPLGRPEIFVVRDGDWRGNPSGRRTERAPHDWVDDFANHQDQIAQRVQRG